MSSSLPITHAVPQGAIRSPLLFSICRNDLPSTTLSCNLDWYVDDYKAFLSFFIKDIEFQAIYNLQSHQGNTSSVNLKKLQLVQNFACIVD